MPASLGSVSDFVISLHFSVGGNGSPIVVVLSQVLFWERLVLVHFCLAFLHKAFAIHQTNILRLFPLWAATFTPGKLHLGFRLCFILWLHAGLFWVQ